LLQCGHRHSIRSNLGHLQRDLRCVSAGYRCGIKREMALEWVALADAIIEKPKPTKIK
jgi:hypothetical protein